MYRTLKRIIVSLKSQFLPFIQDNAFQPQATSVKLSEKADHLDSIQTLHRLLCSENVLIAQNFAVQSEDTFSTHLNAKNHCEDIEYLFCFL